MESGSSDETVLSDIQPQDARRMTETTDAVHSFADDQQQDPRRMAETTDMVLSSANEQPQSPRRMTSLFRNGATYVGYGAGGGTVGAAGGAAAGGVSFVLGIGVIVPIAATASTAGAAALLVITSPLLVPIAVGTVTVGAVAGAAVGVYKGVQIAGRKVDEYKKQEQRNRNRETREVVPKTLSVDSGFFLKQRMWVRGQHVLEEMCHGWCIYATSPATLDWLSVDGGRLKIPGDKRGLFRYAEAATHCTNYDSVIKAHRSGDHISPHGTTHAISPHMICPKKYPTEIIGNASWFPQPLGRRLEVDEPNPDVCSPNEICSKRDAARRLSSNDDGRGSSTNEKDNKIRFTQMYNAGAASGSDDEKQNKAAVDKAGDFLMKATIGKADGDHYGATDQADGAFGMALLIQFGEHDRQTEVTKELLTEKAKRAGGAQKAKVGAWINSIFTNKHKGAKAGDAGVALIKLIQTEIAAGSTNILMTIGSKGDGYGAFSAKKDLSQAHNRFTSDGGQTAGDARAILNLA